MAQLAGMSTEAFEDFYFEVCTLDYRKLQPGMKALKELMDKSDHVEIRGPGTELDFPMDGPADKIQKEAVNRMVRRDRAYGREDFVLMSAVSRRNANIPFHQRPALAILQDWPELRTLFDEAEIRRMVGKTSDPGIEAKSSAVGRLDSVQIVSVALRHDRVDADIS